MYKKEIIKLFIILIFFIFIDLVVLPKKNTTYNLISETTLTSREKNLEEKQTELKNAYQLNSFLDYKIEYSKVLFKDIYHLNKEMTIYKGKNNGVKKDNLIINNEGLVGIVNKVNNNSSFIDLLYNENISLSVKIKDNYGILKCRDNELIIEGIDNKANIQVGDLVTTSDISIYPENIHIGKIKEITYDKYEIEKLVTISPAVDFDNIMYVGILTELRGEE